MGPLDWNTQLTVYVLLQHHFSVRQKFNDTFEFSFPKPKVVDAFSLICPIFRKPCRLEKLSGFPDMLLFNSGAAL